MTCHACLDRRTFALRFYPRHRAAWHIAGRIALLLVVFVAMSVAWKLVGRVWR